jgi:hypothetical protein
MPLLAASSDAAPTSLEDRPRLTHEESWLVPSVHALGLMTTMRVGEALIWPEPFADLRLSFMASRYEDAYTHAPRFDPSRPAFQWDGDPWYVNAVGHSFFGSELYLRARTCRKNVVEALLFTTLASTVWEYGFEANGVRPSAVDLVYTPLAGLAFGEARYLGWTLGSAIQNRTWRTVVTSVFDPFGELERAFGSRC